MSSAANPSSASSDRRPFPLPALWLILLTQAALHLAALPFGGLISDTVLLQNWAIDLLQRPVSGFYARQPRADHLPGDLWIIKLEAWAYHLVSGHAPSDPGFLNALKLGPGLADLGIAAAFYLIAREVAGELTGRRAALLFALNPGPIFISMVWGVADSVSMCVAAFALYFAVRRWSWAAFPALAYACLIKPQFSVLIPVFAIFFLREAWRDATPRAWLRAAAGFAVGGFVSIAVLLATILPFDVGVPLVSRHWSLAGRLRFSANLYDKTTLNALNLWSLGTRASSHFPGLNAPSDNANGLFGLTWQHWGMALTAIACVVLVLPLIRVGGGAQLVFASTGVLFALYMLQTRMHERYSFPAVALMAVAAALRTRWVWVYLAMSAVFLFSLVTVYHWLLPGDFARVAIGNVTGPPGSRAERFTSAVGELNPGEVRLLVAVNLAVLALCLGAAVRDFLAHPSSVLAPIAESPAPSRPMIEANPFPTWPHP